MAYAYCTGCEAPLSRPTLGELVVGRINCRHCESYRLLDDEERVIAIDELEEVLEKARKFFVVGQS